MDANRTQAEIDEMARHMVASRGDPVAWVEAMGDEPWEKQKEILRAVVEHTHVAVRSCHGAGKDWTAARAALHFFRHHIPCLVLTTGPTDRQVKGILWKEIALVYRKAGFTDCQLNMQELKGAVDWYMIGFTAPQRDETRFQGFHEKWILVIVDEAAGVSPEIYASIEGVLSSEGAHLLEIGNPTDPLSGFAYSFKDPDVFKIAISAFDTPNFTEFGITEEDIKNDTWKEKIGDSPLPNPKLVTPAWVARVTRKWGVTSSLYKSRVLGQFPDEAPDSLIPLSWVERCVLADDDFEAASRDGLPVELGVDVARSNDGDHTVIILRRGDYAKIIWSVQTKDTMNIVGRCVSLRAQHRATRIKVDDIGVGGGVVDRLRELNEPVVAANCSLPSDALDETYCNRKAEWLWGLRRRYETGKIILLESSKEEMAGELTAFRWAQDSRGRIKIESKAEMKKRLHGRSPDHADALAIAFAEPEEKKTNQFVLY